MTKAATQSQLTLLKASASALVLSALLATPLWAQTADPTASTGAQLEEVVVTAQKRSENINKVPMSIEAFSASTLQKAAITDVSGLVQMTPGLTFAQSSGNTPIYTLRGVGFNTPNLSSTSPVGIYVDEAAYAYPYMSGGPLFDIDRVEVLKGPQGTLYGRNTTGGLINFITAQPGKTFGAELSTEIGDYGTHNFEGYISVPVSDTLGFRVAGRSENSDDGWQHSLTRPDDRLGRIDKQALRATLNWAPSNRFDVNMMGSYWKNRSDTVAAQAVDFTPQQPAFAVPGLAQTVHSSWSNTEADWPSTATGDPPLRTNSEFAAIAVKAHYTINSSTSIVSLTAYNHIDRYDNNDLSGTPFLVFDDLSTGKIGSFSQELRVLGDAYGLKYIVGGYYSYDRIVDDQVGYYTDTSTNQLLRFLAQDVLDPTNSRYSAAQYADGFSNYRNLLNETSRSASIFANADYNITDKIKISGGLRYEDDLLKYGSCSADYNGNTLPIWNTAVEYLIQATTGTNPGNVVAPNGCLTYLSNYSAAAPYAKPSLDENNLAWRTSASYTPSRNMLLYTTISRGFKSAVVPVLAANVETQLVPAKQEEVLNYEGGAKVGLFDRRVQLNLSVYYDDYTNKQLFSDVLDPVFTVLERIVNVPKSNVKGAEADITWKITSQWQANFGGAYTSSDITKFQGYNRFGVATNFAGSPFPYTPNWQADGGVSYASPITSKLGVQGAINASFQSKSYATLGADPEFEIDPHTVVNMTLGLYSLDDHWRIGLYAKNLFNANYWTSMDVLTDTVFRIPAMPVTFGVKMSYKY